VAKLPTDLSGLEVRAALERAGFVFRRQAGSHMILPVTDLTPGPSSPTASSSDPARSAASSPTPGSPSNNSCNFSDGDNAAERSTASIDRRVARRWLNSRGGSNMNDDAAGQITRLNPPELGVPPGYSHVVDVRASRMIFIAGQTALAEESVRDACGESTAHRKQNGRGAVN
jgi:hypothetical protein